ncbi:MAG: VOC family protein [Anaerolineae bacterium]|nr:VOC family protein [Anaerolineae bacterium]
MTIHFDKISLAVEDFEKMVVFYGAVFQADFTQAEPVPGVKTFTGTIAGVEFALVPNVLAQIEAEQARHQFHFIVEDVEKTIQLALANGGSILDEAAERHGIITGAVYDPDGNPLVFVQN